VGRGRGFAARALSTVVGPLGWGVPRGGSPFGARPVGGGSWRAQVWGTICEGGVLQMRGNGAGEGGLSACLGRGGVGLV
jgi:hypothetical protein